MNKILYLSLIVSAAVVMGAIIVSSAIAGGIVDGIEAIATAVGTFFDEITWLP